MADDERNDAEPVLIRKCDICGADRVYQLEATGSQPEVAVCGCGRHPLDFKDREALEGRGP